MTALSYETNHHQSTNQPKMINENAISLAAAMKKALNDTGLAEKLRDVSVLEHWSSVAGERAAKSCTAKRIEAGKLTVECASPVWRAELMLRKEDLITRLNECAGARVVVDIIFR